MTLLRETDYVERAFFAGWLEALGCYHMTDEQMTTMCDSLRDACSEMVQRYVESMQEDE